jgi:hypothetical protein
MEYWVRKYFVAAKFEVSSPDLLERSTRNLFVFVKSAGIVPGGSATPFARRLLRAQYIHADASALATSDRTSRGAHAGHVTW